MLPSSNWLALKKHLPARPQSERPQKRRKVETVSEGASEESTHIVDRKETLQTARSPRDGNRDSVVSLRQMVYGHDSYSPAHLSPGKFLAIDCEMVGIAGDTSKNDLRTRDKGDESSLARVSVVNYFGAVQLDVHVRQRERVTDWRTPVSGVRESDMVDAKPFAEVQKLVSDLLKDRILVGHAVYNDLKVLLLSHPHSMTRDTQVLAGRHGTLSTSKPRVTTSAIGNSNVKIVVNRRPALRKLVSQELGIDIQAGEHSSVTDARATMAIYRLHRKTWDQGFVPLIRKSDRISSNPGLDNAEGGQPQPTEPSKSGKRRESVIEDDATDSLPTERVNFRPIRPVKRSGISSGISVVVKKRSSGLEAKQIITGTRGTKKSFNSGGKSSAGNWWGTLGK
ncbi:ribonuclease H-like protein [Ramaria rubella]|nr:ribonuclease H-like protein [Ramaria rubella]